MKSLFKAIAWTLGLVIVVVVAAPLIAVAVIDQATIKQEAAAWVKENTGRELTVSGNIVPTVLPMAGCRSFWRYPWERRRLRRDSLRKGRER